MIISTEYILPVRRVNRKVLILYALNKQMLWLGLHSVV